MITKVRLKKTLKAGDNIWVAGTEFPNKSAPAIPMVILKEINLSTGSVEVLERSKPDPIPIFTVPEDFEGTRTTSLRTSNLITPLKEEEEAFEKKLGDPIEKDKKPREEKKASEKPMNKTSLKKRAPRVHKVSKPKLKIKGAS